MASTILSNPLVCFNWEACHTYLGSLHLDTATMAYLGIEGPNSFVKVFVSEVGAFDDSSGALVVVTAFTIFLAIMTHPYCFKALGASTISSAYHFV